MTDNSAMVNLTKNFMRVVPSEKKKVQLIPEAIVCHIDESTLFESTVSGEGETTCYSSKADVKLRYVGQVIRKVGSRFQGTLP